MSGKSKGPKKKTTKNKNQTITKKRENEKKITTKH